MTKIRFVYFDLGNVLLKFSLRRLIHQVAEVVETDGETVRAVLFGDKKYLAFECGEITSEEYFTHLCQGFGKEIPVENFLQATNNIFWVNEPILPLLRHLSKSLFPRGVLSNTGPQHWRYTQEAFPCIWDLFPHHRIASFAVRSMKPFDPIYQIAFEEAQKELPDLTVDEILFIDDLEENVLGAKKFGFDSIVYTDHESLLDEFKRRNLPVPEDE